MHVELLRNTCECVCRVSAIMTWDARFLSNTFLPFVLGSLYGNRILGQRVSIFQRLRRNLGCELRTQDETLSQRHELAKLHVSSGVAGTQNPKSFNIGALIIR